LKIKCGECQTINDVDVDLTKVEVVKKEGHTNEIKLTDTMGVIMRYPTIEDSSVIDPSVTEKSGSDEVDKAKNAEQSIKLIASCIDVIFDKDKIYKTKDFSKEEVIEFIDNLSQGMFQKIAMFFDDMPALRHTIKFSCKKCNVNNEIGVKGIQDFFT
jgi:hypothetical protein